MSDLSYEDFTDAAREGSPRPYKYRDVLGNVWIVTWDMDSSTWSVAPVVDTYGNPAGRLAFFGETPRLLRKAVDNAAATWRSQQLLEESKRRAEAERLRQAAIDAEMLAVEQRQKASSSSAGWFVLVAVALLVLGENKRR